VVMHKRVVRRSDQPKIRHADHERHKNTSLQTREDISTQRLFTSKGRWTISKTSTRKRQRVANLCSDSQRLLRTVHD
jgi:hypothetical protein